MRHQNRVFAPAFGYRFRIMKRIFVTGLVLVLFTVVSGVPAQQAPPATARPVNPRVEQLKKEAIADIDSRAQFTQQFVDQVFSYAELGFQEFETSTYITG